MTPEENKQLREQLEVRIVALLLGEASDFERAELQELMAKDPELAAFHERMKGTIGLVHATSKEPPADVSTASQEQPKLSAERRQVLLSVFREQPASAKNVTAMPESGRKVESEGQRIRKSNHW